MPRVEGQTTSCEWTGRRVWLLPWLGVFAACRQGAVSEWVDPRQLLPELIQSAQRASVRASYGVWEGQAFTSLMLNDFEESRGPARIARSVAKDRRFQELVRAMRKMPPSERESLISSCRVPLRPSWERIHRVDPAGQTEAGRQAELLVADAILNEIQRQLGLSEQRASPRR